MKPVRSRINIDLRMYRHSGIGRYLRNLLPVLLPRIEADAIRLIVHPGLLDAEPWLSDPRIEQVAFRAPIYSPAEQAFPLTGLYRDSDLLWTPHYNVPFAYRGKLAVTLHDLAPLALRETFTNPLKRFYASCLIRHAAAHAAAILTVSEFTAHELQQRLGVDPARITVTYPGLDRHWPTEPPPRPPSASPPYLLYVGNVKPNKNLGMLLKAFASVLDRIPYRLVLAGRMRGFGTEDTAVFRQADALGDRIRWVGEVSETELIALYTGAEALVMPSLYEGFGLPPLEAMQLGCPVLCSNAASLPEVAASAALFFDPRDQQALSCCLVQVADSALMQTLRQRGYQRVAHFSYNQCGEQTAAVLNRLLRSTP